MKIKKQTLFLCASMILMLLMVTTAYMFTSKANEEEKHYVTKVTPASYTEVIEYYGNEFLIDDTHIALCVEREKGTPYPGLEVTLVPYDDPYINKILYYGYNGPEEWDGFSSKGEAVMVTSIMLSDAYSNYGYKSICDDYKAYLESAPDSPVFELDFHPTSPEIILGDNIQYTEEITLNGDERLSLTLTLADYMTLHHSDGKKYTGTVTLHGGDRFYISAPLNDYGVWDSSILYINEKYYSTIMAVTQSDAVQELVYLVPNTPTDTASFSINWYDMGQLKIIKSSTYEDMTFENENYTLAGACYGVYPSRDDALSMTQPITTIKTDEYGYGISEPIKKGEYYVREITSPAGFQLSPEIHKVTIDTLITTELSVSEEPVYTIVDILLKKENTDKVPLANAEFKIDYYESIFTDVSLTASLSPTRSWTLKTDNKGEIKLDKAHLVKGDDFYYYKEQIILPKGTLIIRETKAPIGYITDSTPILFSLDNSDTSTLFNPPTITNKMITGRFQLTKLGETATGNTPLKNAGFMACPVEELSKDSKGNYIWDSSKTIPLTNSGEKELFTNESGYAISRALPYGTYLIRETTVPANYFPVDDFLVTISTYSEEPQEMLYFTDESFKSYLEIKKYDSSSEQLILNNEATFKIWSVDTSSYVSFQITDGNSAYSIEEFQTDSKGILITPKPLMPGKYIIEEIHPPEGYMLSSVTGYPIEISKDDNSKWYVDSEGKETTLGVFTMNVSNTPKTGTIEVYKTGENPLDDDNEKPLPLAEIIFNIYAEENIYSPDGQDTLIYSKNQLVESITTDKNGYGATSIPLPPGTYYMTEENTPEIYEPSDTIYITVSPQDSLLEIEKDGSTITTLLYTYKIENKLKELPPEDPTTEESTTTEETTTEELTTEEITTEEPTTEELTTEEVTTEEPTTEEPTTEVITTEEITTEENTLISPATGDDSNIVATFIILVYTFFLIILFVCNTISKRNNPT